MQTYEGYFENEKFHPKSPKVTIPDGQAIVILEGPAKTEKKKRSAVTGKSKKQKPTKSEAAKAETIKKRLAAWDEFFAAIESAKDEEVPEFERIKLREVEI